MATTVDSQAGAVEAREGPIILSGGYVSPAAFPGDRLAALAADILRTRAAEALQYGPEDGYLPLRRLIAEWLMAEGVVARPEEIATVTGAKQNLDMCARAFSAGGRPIVVPEPVYMNGLKIFRTAGVTFLTVPSDDGGIDVDALERLLASADRPSLIYVIPDFNNPDGAVMPEERREKLVGLAERYEVLVLEDGPYRWTRFEGEPRRPLKHFDRQGVVISTGTFSKILAPGLRVGWVHARKDLLHRILAFKADGGVSPLPQMLACEFFKEAGSREQHHAVVAGMLRHRRDLVSQRLADHFGEDATWSTPHGSNYTWVRFRGDVDTDVLSPRAKAAGVAYFPGSMFYARPDPPHNYLRLCYSFETEKRISAGIDILADVFGSRAKKAG